MTGIPVINPDSFESTAFKADGGGRVGFTIMRGVYHGVVTFCFGRFILTRTAARRGLVMQFAWQAGRQGGMLFHRELNLIRL